MKAVSWLAAGAVLALSAHAREASTPPSINAFLNQPLLFSAELSPSGQWLSMIRDESYAPHIILTDLDSENPAFSGQLLGENIIVNWVEWANEETLILSITLLTDGQGNLVSLSKLSDSNLADMRRHIWPVTRLMLMDRKTKSMRRVFAGDRLLEKNLYLGSVVSFLPDDPEHFLMATRLRGDLDLFRINVRTGDHERVAIGAKNTGAWYVDSAGEPAFRVDFNRRGTRATFYGREDRDNGSIKWRKLKSVRIDRNGNDNVEQATEFRPIAPGPDIATYYVAARPSGANTTGIYLYNFETDTFVENLKSDDRFDIESALINWETGEYLGSYHYEDTLKIDYLDPVLQTHISRLDDQFEGQSNVVPLDSSRDGKRWLVETIGPLDGGTYLVYDTEKAELTPVGMRRPALKPETLSPVQVIHYTARDGLPLTGYYTRPVGLEAGAIPPLVVMPHGGPEMRDTLTFDGHAQLLASHGYAVFQPNFRGSSGYGLHFADAGRRQWGLAMQTDIEDGLKHLMSEGLARAGNACIYGYSYGGYAALAAATLTPDDYECVIAGSGPSDLSKMVRWIGREEGFKSENYEYWTAHIGHPSHHRDEMEAVSPALLASRVLLIHGKEDVIVPVEQSEYMHKALKEAGKDVTYLELKNSGHSFRPVSERQTEMETVLAFLAQHLTPPNAEVSTTGPAGTLEEEETASLSPD